jgi:hypothetical protein
MNQNSYVNKKNFKKRSMSCRNVAKENQERKKVEKNAAQYIDNQSDEIISLFTENIKYFKHKLRLCGIEDYYKQKRI